MTTSFGARLRSHRERRGIGLDAISQSTKIRVALFEALERDDTSRWPSGIFRRAFVRAYATAVGLDPELTLSEFLERFPDPNNERRTEISGGRTSAAPLLSCDAPSGPLRLTLADEPPLPLSTYVHALRLPWPRVAAAACDLLMVVAIASAVFAVFGAFWTPFTVATVCYYFGGMLIVGNSPAAYLFCRGQRTPIADRPVAAPELLPGSAGVEADHVTPFSTRRYPRAV